MGFLRSARAGRRVCPWSDVRWYLLGASHRLNHPDKNKHGQSWPGRYTPLVPSAVPSPAASRTCPVCQTPPLHAFGCGVRPCHAVVRVSEQATPESCSGTSKDPPLPLNLRRLMYYR